MENISQQSSNTQSITSRTDNSQTNTQLKQVEEKEQNSQTIQQEFNIQKQENNNQNNNNKNKNSDEIDKQIQNYLQKIDMQARESTYAGYWYTKNASELSIQLQIWFEMAKCEIQNIKDIKAILSPHQGYAFSGPTAAWPFKYVKQYCQNKQNLKVFIFGSAHYCFLRSCSVSSLKKYKTPLGDIKLDTQIINDLLENEVVNFEETDKDADEEEYSIEMQLPFLIKALGIDNFTLIPILVGSFDEKLEEKYAQVFQKYFDSDNSLFIISSDFCHWGNKYKYTYVQNEEQEIYESIEKLDQNAMELIELHNIQGFHQYIQETGNTICGKNSIGILLRLFLKTRQTEIETKFIKYNMDKIINDRNDNCISFAASVSFTE